MPTTQRSQGLGAIGSVIKGGDLVRISLVMSSTYGLLEFGSQTYLGHWSVLARTVLKLVGMLSVWALLVEPLRRQSLVAAHVGDLERQLSRGLDMVRTEQEARQVAGFALGRIAPGENMQLLLTERPPTRSPGC